MGAPKRDFEVCVVGGAGRVGAPLALLFAKHGVRTLIHDLNRAALDTLAAGRMPFAELGGDALLRTVLDAGMLGFSPDARDVAGIPHVVVTIGTPIDEFHNPVLRVVTDCLDALLPRFTDAQTLVLRSTVFPGCTEYVDRYLRGHGRAMRVAFCPERVVQGYSLRELETLPQLVSGTTPEAEEVAAKLFATIAPSIVRMSPREAELAKLFSNAWRYIQFAVTNQFYMIAEQAGVDYARVLEGAKQGYPRLKGVPGPGLAAGPCLYKDTLQLAALTGNQFSLGQAAVQVNEGLPAFMVAQLAKRHALEACTVGLLGMAFKPSSDDARSSLSYKLKKQLQFAARGVLTTDPYVTSDPDLLPVDEVVRRSDVLVMCAPHPEYRALDTRGKPMLDIWNVHGRDVPTPGAPT